MPDVAYGGTVGYFYTPTTDQAMLLHATNPQIYPSIISYVRFHDSQTLKNLYCKVYGNGAPGSTILETYKNHTTYGNLLVTIPAGQSGVFEDTTHTDSVSSGDVWGYYWDVSSTTAISIWGVRVVSSTTTNSIKELHSWVIAGIVGKTTVYAALGHSYWNATEVFTQVTVQAAFVFERISLGVTSGNVGGGTLTLRKNGASGNNIATCPEAQSGWFEDTTHTDTAAAGDEIDFKCTGTVSKATWLFDSAQVRATFSDRSIVITGGAVSGSGGYGTDYTGWEGWSTPSTPWGDIEHNHSTSFPGAWKNLGVTCTVAPTANVTITARKNGASTSLVVTIPSGQTGIFQDTTHSVDFDATDYLGYMWVGNSGSTSVHYAEFLPALIAFVDRSFSIQTQLTAYVNRSFSMNVQPAGATAYADRVFTEIVQQTAYDNRSFSVKTSHDWSDRNFQYWMELTGYQDRSFIPQRTDPDAPYKDATAQAGTNGGQHTVSVNITHGANVLLIISGGMNSYDTYNPSQVPLIVSCTVDGNEATKIGTWQAGPWTAQKCELGVWYYNVQSAGTNTIVLTEYEGWYVPLAVQVTAWKQAAPVSPIQSSWGTSGGPGVQASLGDGETLPRHHTKIQCTAMQSNPGSESLGAFQVYLSQGQSYGGYSATVNSTYRHNDVSSNLVQDWANSVYWCSCFVNVKNDWNFLDRSFRLLVKGIGNTPVTVCSISGLAPPPQRAVIHTNGTYVVFYKGSNSYLCYRTSMDEGQTWEIERNASHSTLHSSYLGYSAMWDGSNIYIIYGCGSGSSIQTYVRKGTAGPNIVWQSAVAVGPTNTGYSVYSLTKTQNWIVSCFVCLQGSPNFYQIYIHKSTDGGLNWTQIGQFALDTGMWNELRDISITRWPKYSDGLVLVKKPPYMTAYLCKKYDGSSWDTDWTTIDGDGAIDTMAMFSLCTYGTQVHMVYRSYSSPSYLIKYAYLEDSWSTPVTLDSQSMRANHTPTVSPHSSGLFGMWVQSEYSFLPPYILRYRKMAYSTHVWDSVVDWIVDENNPQNFGSEYQPDNNIAGIWSDASSNLRFATIPLGIYPQPNVFLNRSFSEDISLGLQKLLSESFTPSDASVKKPSKPFSETFAPSEFRYVLAKKVAGESLSPSEVKVLGIYLKRSQAIQVDESFSKMAAWYRILNESPVFVDYADTFLGIAIWFYEPFGWSDSRRVHMDRAPFMEGMPIAEGRVLGVFKGFPEEAVLYGTMVLEAGKAALESFTQGDILSFGNLKALSEAQALAESRVMSILSYKAESIPLAEAIMKTSGKGLADVLSIADNFWWAWYLALVDGLSPSDSLQKVLILHKALGEALAIVGAIGFPYVTQHFWEYPSILDKRKMKPAFGLADAFTPTDLQATKMPTKRIRNTLYLLEARVKKKPTKAIAQGLPILDTISTIWSLGAFLSEVVGVQELLSRVWEAKRQHAESFGVSEARRVFDVLGFPEGLELLETSVRNVTSRKAEAVPFSEARRMTVGKDRKEQFTLQGALGGFHLFKPFQELTTFVDSVFEATSIPLAEGLPISGEFSRTGYFDRRPSEDLSVDELRTMRPELPFLEGMSIIDFLYMSLANILNLVEGLGIGELIVKEAASTMVEDLFMFEQRTSMSVKPLQDETAVIEGWSLTLGKVLPEALKLEGVLVLGNILAIFESGLLLDTLRKDASTGLLEWFEVSGLLAKEGNIGFPESFGVLDEYSRIWQAIRPLGEDIQLIDKFQTGLSFFLTEALSVVPGLLKELGKVLSERWKPWEQTFLLKIRKGKPTVTAEFPEWIHIEPEPQLPWGIGDVSISVGRVTPAYALAGKVDIEYSRDVPHVEVRLLEAV